MEAGQRSDGRRKRERVSVAWRRVLAVIVAGLAVLAPLPLRAQADPQRKAAAEALFSEGQKLLYDGDNEAACQRFEQSQTLDPGVGTLLYLGECYDRLGRTASAWANYREAESAARAAGQLDRARVARERAAKDEPQLARLAVQVADANPRESFELTINGKVLSAALFDVAFPIDPGRYELVARGFGRKPWTSLIEIEPARQQTVQVPALEATTEVAALPAADPYAASSANSASTASSAAVTDTPSTLSPRKQASIVVAAGGVAALATGVALGLVASGKDDDATRACGSICPDPGKAEALNEQAQDWAVGANIAYAVGGLALITSGVLFLWPEKAASSTSPTARRAPFDVSAQLGPSGGLLTIGGTL